ncbi:hypothetical protein [Flexivirga oryzae]|uniref:ParB/Sulfiredoxin domain-containing protein n=1 Tax=Flexivirga oryzae TaxID=1794944 RepID=A0A839N8L8_9MICO|nr:hypothetical protein [Flexivirga oryzae]MBB2891555.1 hypothetical protein [Flexivirga oryzae]
MRTKTQTITPAKAATLLEANTANRPLSKATVHAFAEAMRRGDWKTTHQGIAIASNGELVDGQHRLAAIIEADIPVKLTVFTDVSPDTFDVLDTGKKRNAADVLAIEGEKYSLQLASMLRTVWLHDNRPNTAWSGGNARVTNHQILETLEANPGIRDYIVTGEQLANQIGMIKSAAGAASYLVARKNSAKKLEPWFEGLIEGAGLSRTDARLKLRNLMLNMARRQAGEGRRRHDTREQVVLYLTAFAAWTSNEPVSRLRYTTGDDIPAIPKI